ncbi:glycosyltransferase family 2 protein [Capnocytophaga sp. ARDL2]|uniref:glycosyltransferase family 2 protein n=1 Tax=Capnocytophaga sp. ARDL2 TaxID=3238809 RepID=UPI003555FE7D
MISIIVPCFNQAQYLDECLQSVLEQTYQNWECIIVNDGSPDNTEEVAKKWCEEDARFQYVLKENGGLSSARNTGIQEAKGEWILPLDCDDKISNRYLELAAKEFDKGYTVIYCQAAFFGAKNEKWHLPEYSFKGQLYNNHIFCSAFFKKQDWEKVGGYDTAMKHGYEDWEFWLHILTKDSKVYRIPQVCFYYRQKEQSMITDLMAQQEVVQSTRAYIFEKHQQKYFEIYGRFFNKLRFVYDKKQPKIAVILGRLI